MAQATWQPSTRTGQPPTLDVDAYEIARCRAIQGGQGPYRSKSPLDAIRPTGFVDASDQANALPDASTSKPSATGRRTTHKVSDRGTQAHSDVPCGTYFARAVCSVSAPPFPALERPPRSAMVVQLCLES